MALSVATVRFDYEAVLPAGVFEQITELRIHRPGMIKEEAQRRKKRTALTRDGKLVLLALDHAARGVHKFDKTDWQWVIVTNCWLARGESWQTRSWMGLLPPAMYWKICSFSTIWNGNSQAEAFSTAGCS